MSDSQDFYIVKLRVELAMECHKLVFVGGTDVFCMSPLPSKQGITFGKRLSSFLLPEMPLSHPPF